MIISIKHKGLKALYERGFAKGVQQDHVKKLRLILAALDVAESPDDMSRPSFKLHPLKGEMAGHWSVWVNGNWRITWRFTGHDVELVDYQDYH
ncbi:proteic killer suppression protein [Kushneria avicenniae]|uniref:Proteic killer suppression protein n=1 Tax=Kushneria avicenniae TaxID=402385 RepID=A0A1I1MUV4_9GAMM|nr:type II toxin-antitoxin system RelE/ParE family toxin [Kushneria avicenniae]SFC86363.1 proteic killer suppression protein [Kushneria avicenniae]